MPRDFPYDTVTLIQAIRESPAIWDKSLESYKDRVERRSAWEAIFRTLNPAYDELSDEDKRIVVEEQVLTKWTNIRDTFLKSLKLRKGKPKKKYLLHEHLIFLTKNLPPEERQYTAEEEWYPTDYITEDEPPKQTTSTKKRKKHSEVLKKERRSHHSESPLASNDEDADSSNVINFVKCDESSEPRLMNEDEAFFASLLPTVVRYTVEERLDFRMEVLSVMKRINDRKQYG